MTGDPLGDVLLFAAPLGLAGVFLLALFERIVPVLPSHGLYAAIGIAAAEGAWGLPAAIILSVLGSGAGAFATYRVGIRIAAGEGRAILIRRLLRRRDRLGRYLRGLQRHGGALPFVEQLLPAARLVAPLIAAATPHDWRRLSIATLAGLTVWNTTFIAIGFAMVRFGGPANATMVSATLLALLAGVFIVIRLIKHRRASRWRPSNAPHRLLFRCNAWLRCVSPCRGFIDATGRSDCRGKARQPVFLRGMPACNGSQPFPDPRSHVSAPAWL